MEIHPIRNEEDYQQALQVVSRLIDADPARGMSDGERLQVLATLIERYEAEHFPLDRRQRLRR